MKKRFGEPPRTWKTVKSEHGEEIEGCDGEPG